VSIGEYHLCKGVSKKEYALSKCILYVTFETLIIHRSCLFCRCHSFLAYETSQNNVWLRVIVMC
jgi:hypothetical protein